MVVVNPLASSSSAMLGGSAGRSSFFAYIAPVVLAAPRLDPAPMDGLGLYPTSS
jgi:hypothetical protein